LEEAARVRLRVFDIRGRMVRGLIEGIRKPGQHVTEWNGCDELGRVMPSGVYFCQLESGELVSTKRTVLVR
jgi:flagellar hook assembly protein FlgD